MTDPEDGVRGVQARGWHGYASQGAVFICSLVGNLIVHRLAVGHFDTASVSAVAVVSAATAALAGALFTRQPTPGQARGSAPLSFSGAPAVHLSDGKAWMARPTAAGIAELFGVPSEQWDDGVECHLEYQALAVGLAFSCDSARGRSGSLQYVEIEVAAQVPDAGHAP